MCQKEKLGLRLHRNCGKTSCLSINKKKVLKNVFFYRQMSGAHPITGIIVLVLSVIQPIAAAFRPHPGDDKYVFFITFVEFRDVVRAIDLLLLTDYSLSSLQSIPF